jgi:hypothetical protein
MLVRTLRVLLRPIHASFVVLDSAGIPVSLEHFDQSAGSGQTGVANVYASILEKKFPRSGGCRCDLLQKKMEDLQTVPKLNQTIITLTCTGTHAKQ